MIYYAHAPYHQFIFIRLKLILHIFFFSSFFLTFIFAFIFIIGRMSVCVCVKMCVIITYQFSHQFLCSSHYFSPDFLLPKTQIISVIFQNHTLKILNAENLRKDSSYLQFPTAIATEPNNEMKGTKRIFSIRIALLTTVQDFPLFRYLNKIFGTYQSL